MQEGTILLVEDDADCRLLYSKTMQAEGFEVILAESSQKAFKLLKERDIDLVLSDVNLAHINGLELIGRYKELNPFAEVIMLTAYGSVKDGVQAIKTGAYDYLIKGEDNKRLLPMLQRAIDKVRLHKRLHRLEQQVGQHYTFQEVIGKSEPLQQAISMARQVAGTNATVLLLGETGTGKEIFARAIHAASTRAKAAFVALNCSAFGKELLESELFGHKAGSFTGATHDKKGLFEEAHGGTLFLDEIGEMPLELQAKLLRVLETSTFIKVGDTKTSRVDVRIIAATNKKLANAHNAQFRPDLYYRLSVFEINLPPLRERKEDIPLLARAFMAHFGQITQKKIVGMSREFEEQLMRYPWKGNIRELRNVIERAVILTDGSLLDEAVLPYEVKFGPSLEEQLQESNQFDLAFVERTHIQRVLKLTRGNKAKTARMLNIGLSTLYRKLSEYNLQEAEA
ncbi:sigma-54-dependent transcriptional regulator [Cesiribacter andamanensis]|uniref:Transcriptional regulatory protein ZraR n=1 Tax=Cesiribacter andamanensis AMV16 TaxID=1279009 RepID=M7NCC1_9BACT|nr:sigma-54 dependent transcriptional regulator [Cesiribacter andamanensis]EMR04796.1 Transcriptional regulatory protein ZraR [Cesiribacter andamanensis AMV16]